LNLDTHFVGGGRYWGKWEIADIGLLVAFRQRGRIVGTKGALLQSKRLYPDELQVAADVHAMDYQIGFARLLASDSEYISQVKPRTCHFSPDSKYRALEYKEEQYQAILEYAKDTGIPVYYLLYNPIKLPWSASVPAASTIPPLPKPLKIGCRVINSSTLDVKLSKAKLSKSENPCRFE
jgi:hypothetical protein